MIFKFARQTGNLKTCFMSTIVQYLASDESIFFFDLLSCSFIKLRTSIFGFPLVAILKTE